MELTNAQMLGSDVYLKTTEKDGRASYTHHRVYDRDKFLQSKRSLIGTKEGPLKIDIVTEKVFKENGGRS